MDTANVIYIAEKMIMKFNLVEVDKLIDEFVADLTKHRDKSHGYDHLREVSRYAVYIAVEEGCSQEVLVSILLVAWLHDLIDHKYPDEAVINIRKITEFITKHNLAIPSLILNIIDRISYSKEVAHGDSEWKSVIGISGIRIRNIVSDADKLTAMGAAGVKRCAEYIKEKYPAITQRELNYKLLNHANEKLLLLKDKFIRTTTGKNLAEPLHYEMIEELLDI